jgi:hypothetical protein
MGVIFWLGVFTWFSVVAWTRFLRERERQQTLRSFATSGRAMDPETMERLFPKHLFAAQGTEAATPESTARGLLIGGIVTLSAGIGLLIGAQLISNIAEEALWGMSAGGVIAGCVGLGLVVSSIVLRRSIDREKARIAADADLR